MKTCSRCKKSQPLEEFRARARASDGRGSTCRPCLREADNLAYKNKPERRRKIKESNNRRVHEQRLFVRNHLETHPCVDCGERDPDVLEFDHVRGVKSANISQLIRHAVSVETLQAEIDKCDVRCANCHRKRTVTQLGWYEWLTAPVTQRIE